MDAHSRIDITFDFRSDTPGYPKHDPDARSPTLRRYHKLLWSKPLRATIARYADFFSLFGDFRGYVGFFMLQDLVTEDCSAVRFFSPFDDFTTSPVPGGIEAYRAYRELAIKFIEARNSRILQFY